MRILLAEDEAALSSAIEKILTKNNYAVDAVYNGVDALQYLDSGNYDAVIMDVMMPRLDGLTVIRKLRKKGNQLPIIILSAKGDVEDKIAGLDSGANDYLAKPFDTRELLARLRAITRNMPTAINDCRLTFGNVSLNRATFELSTPTASVRLTNKEFQMMQLLMANPLHLISPERMIEKIWGFDTEVNINVVWVYMSNLRKKLASLDADVTIRVSRNVGYTLGHKV
jgi:DNA-binding response OmpR family regulator